MKTKLPGALLAVALATANAGAEQPQPPYDRDLRVEVWTEGQQNRDRYDGALDRTVSIPVHPFLIGKGWACSRRPLRVSDTSFGIQVDCWSTFAGSGASTAVECGSDRVDQNTSTMIISTGGEGYVNATQWFRLSCSTKRSASVEPKQGKKKG